MIGPYVFTEQIDLFYAFDGYFSGITLEKRLLSFMILPLRILGALCGSRLATFGDVGLVKGHQHCGYQSLHMWRHWQNFLRFGLEERTSLLYTSEKWNWISSKQNHRSWVIMREENANIKQKMTTPRVTNHNPHGPQKIRVVIGGVSFYRHNHNGMGDGWEKTVLVVEDDFEPLTSGLLTRCFTTSPLMLPRILKI